MKPTTNSDARERLAHVLVHQRQVHTNVLALRKNRNEFRRVMVAQVQTVSAPPGSINPFSVDNTRGAMVALAESDLVIRFAATQALLDVMENSEEFKEASAIIDPLLAEVAQLEAEEERQRQARDKAERDLHNAREAAKKRALDNIETDPAVIAAKQKLKD